MLLGLLSAKVVDEARDSILAFESDPVRMSLIDQIRELSPTVDSRFLSRFTAQDLSGYLSHLRAASVPRGRLAVWVRPGGVPALCGRDRVA